MGCFAALTCFVVLVSLSTSHSASVLSTLAFKNNGTVTSTDSFSYQSIPCGYLEPREVRRSRYAWAASGQCSYLFAQQDNTTCTPGAPRPGCDHPAGDLFTIVLPAGDAATNAVKCSELCCNTTSCMSYVYAVAPGDYLSCKAGDACCYIKGDDSTPVASTVKDIYCGEVSGHSLGKAPPSGMRSAVPQGGLGAGSVELRADGTFNEWTLMNQSPAGGAKIATFDAAFIGVRVVINGQQHSAALRTTPPAGIQGVSKLTYGGAYPVGRLETSDFPVNVTLYAYSSYHLNDLTRSSKPSITYKLVVNNPTSSPAAVSLFMSMPLAVEENTARPAASSSTWAVPEGGSSATDCRNACQESPDCLSWTLSGGTCSLSADTPLNVYADNSFSGVRSSFSVESNAAANCLSLNFAGVGPTAGTASLCSSNTNAAQTMSSSDDLSALWAQFASSGTLTQALNGSYGAIAVEQQVAGGAEGDLGVVMSWYFPERDYLGVTVGNHYANVWASSLDVAAATLADDADNLASISSLHNAFFNSSLPDWLQDALINTLSHVRSAWRTDDGRWRQWEAYDCVNVDSVHNDGERHIPYIMFFPETTRNKLVAWGKYALANGMIQEQLGCGCTAAVPQLDDACGRIMSDVTSMFLMYVYELYAWGNDTETLQSLWPHVEKAAQWQIDVSADVGIPQHLVATYDILALNKYPTATYNGVFHLMAMKAAAALSKAVGNNTFAATCNAAFERGQEALDNLLWVENGTASHYAAVQGVNASVMGDTMYGQVLAYSAGLGELLRNMTRFELHLATEGRDNDTPYGIRAITGATVGGTDDTIWQGASPNWCSLNLRHFGKRKYEEALSQPSKSLNLWRTGINDQWNTAGLVSSQGLPYITSHYGFHMVEWHIPLAISGQIADLPNNKLGFAPTMDAPYRLPVILPGVLGSLEASAAPSCRYTFSLAMGNLNLTTLEVNGSLYPGSTTVTPGAPVSWAC